MVDLEEFLSTPSARRATSYDDDGSRKPVISIHALREEGDLTVGNNAGGLTPFLSTPSARRATATKAKYRVSFEDFYPRPPRGGRPSMTRLRDAGSIFLSTPSARRATRPPASSASKAKNFYPRPPRGGRRDFSHWEEELYQFLSTPSARRATTGSQAKQQRTGISIHALREEGDSGAVVAILPR